MYIHSYIYKLIYIYIYIYIYTNTKAMMTSFYPDIKRLELINYKICRSDVPVLFNYITTHTHTHACIHTPLHVYMPHISDEMVIDVRNGHGDPSSNSGRGYLHL